MINWASSHHREKKGKCAIIKNWSDRGKRRVSSSQEQQAINRPGSRRDQGTCRTGLRRRAARSRAFRPLESSWDVSEDVFKSSLCQSVSVHNAIKVKWTRETQTWCGMLLSGCFLLSYEEIKQICVIASGWWEGRDRRSVVFIVSKLHPNTK